jgi:hypothetical protein
LAFVTLSENEARDVFPRDPAMTDPLPDGIDEALWDEAVRRGDAIRSFLKLLISAEN